MALSISIVIPNYNGRELLKANLPYVFEALSSSNISDYEIIICDDASHDDSVEFIQKKYTNIILIKAKQNLGFSRNTNKGIFQAAKDLIFIMNNDVQLKDMYFKHCLEYFKNKNTFGVMGSILSKDGRQIDSAKYPSFSLNELKGTVNYRYLDSANKKKLTLFLSGANALVDRVKIQKMRGFDEIYSPYYSEDLDLGLRAWRLGYRCYFEEKAICIHETSTTIGKEKPSKVKIISKRNKFLLHYIHLDPFDRFLWLLTIHAKLIGRLILFELNYLKSYITFIQKIPQAQKSRKSLRKMETDQKMKISFKKIISDIKKEIGNKIEKF